MLQAHFVSHSEPANKADVCCMPLSYILSCEQGKDVAQCKLNILSAPVYYRICLKCLTFNTARKMGACAKTTKWSSFHCGREKQLPWESKSFGTWQHSIAGSSWHTYSAAQDLKRSWEVLEALFIWSGMHPKLALHLPAQQCQCRSSTDQGQQMPFTDI